MTIHTAPFPTPKATIKSPLRTYLRQIYKDSDRAIYFQRIPNYFQRDKTRIKNFSQYFRFGSGLFKKIFYHVNMLKYRKVILF